MVIENIFGITYSSLSCVNVNENWIINSMSGFGMGSAGGNWSCVNDPYWFDVSTVTHCLQVSRSHTCSGIDIHGGLSQRSILDTGGD